MSSNTINRIFIANRGEIARRIALTARRMGIESVAISDRRHPPAFLMEAVTIVHRVEEESPATYLNMDLMIGIARENHCDAIHPGFGFLSENEEFARKVEEAGLNWIGPNPKAIDAMASKASARDFAIKANVPCIQGLSGFHVPADESGDFSEIESFASKAGYPLLIKAAYGGGGKGMRIINKAEEIRPFALRARSEAINSFGNGALICEQYLTAPRHVEVQILADKHGQVFAVGDRDCSMQRRHQKIIEEAPAPNIGPETRKKMHEAAVALARGVHYDSTGTVEFLLDWSEQARSQNEQPFYFLEMNTRLQVEHPVSEEVFGIDLVEWQIRVARGEKIPAGTVATEPRGHSIELRIYAEDAGNNFFPAPGPVGAFLPASGPGLRWETGLDAIDEITGRFDPMIAKLIATAANRTAALDRLKDALERTFFAGPVNNMPLLTQLVSQSEFRDGPVTTHFIQDQLAAITAAIKVRADIANPDAEEIFKLLKTDNLQAKTYGGMPITTTSISNWIFAGNSGSAQKDDVPAHQALPLMNGVLTSPNGLRTDYGCARLTLAGGKPSLIWYASLSSSQDSNGTQGKDLWVQINGCLFHRRQERVRGNHSSAVSAASATAITAPVPGKVIAVKASAGDAVESGQTVFILESMKMEFEVKAAKSGVIMGIKVATGVQVAAGAVLAEWQD